MDNYFTQYATDTLLRHCGALALPTAWGDLAHNHAKQAVRNARNELKQHINSKILNRLERRTLIFRALILISEAEHRLFARIVE